MDALIDGWMDGWLNFGPVCNNIHCIFKILVMGDAAHAAGNSLSLLMVIIIYKYRIHS